MHTRELAGALVALLALSAVACGGGTGPDRDDPPRLSLSPSNGLVQAVGSGSEEFTWPLFRGDISVRITRGEYGEELKLCAVQVVGDEVRSSDCSPSVEADPAALAAGLLSGDLVPADAPPFAPGEEWFPLAEWSPTEFVLPAAFNFPRQNNVVNALRSDVSLGEGEGMVIVFAATDDPFTVPGEVPFRVKPFALKLARRQGQ